MDTASTFKISQTEISGKLEEFIPRAIADIRRDIELLRTSGLRLQRNAINATRNYDAKIIKYVESIRMDRSAEDIARSYMTTTKEDGENVVIAKRALVVRYDDLRNNLPEDDIPDALEELNDVVSYLIHIAMAMDYVVDCNKLTRLQEKYKCSQPGAYSFPSWNQGLYYIDDAYNRGARWKDICSMLSSLQDQYPNKDTSAMLVVYSKLFASAFNFPRYYVILQKMQAKRIKTLESYVVTRRIESAPKIRKPTKKQLKREILLAAYASGNK